jgi:RHS repeat-associated protein
MKIGTILFSVVMLVAITVSLAVLYGLFSGKITNKAGPAWIWRWGTFDPIRNVFFRQDGSLRRASIFMLVPLAVFLLLGSIALLLTALAG